MNKSDLKNTYKRQVCLIAFVACLPTSGFAGGAIVGATEFTQIANNVELLASVQTQIDTYRQIVQSLNLDRLNIQSLGDSFLTNPASALLRLRRAVQRDGELGRATVYTLENLDNQFPGYAHYLEQTDPEQTIDTYMQWDTRSRDNVRAALESVGANREQLITEGQLIRKLQQQSQSVSGQKQAIQVGNDIALAQIAQNQRLQVLLERQIELQANYQLQEQDRREKDRAASDRLHDYEKPSRSTGPDWIKQAPSPFE